MERIILSYCALSLAVVRHTSWLKIYKATLFDLQDCPFSNMSSTGAKVVCAVTALVARKASRSNDRVTPVPLSSEQIDAGKWIKHYQNRSENLFKALQYYWIISLVSIGILYWCPLLWLY